MTTPAAYAKHKDEERKRLHENQKIADVAAAERRAEEKVLYDKIVKAFHPYRKCELEGKKVVVQFDDKAMQVKFFVNGYHWATIRPERHWYNCACENVCDHTPGTWVTLDATTHRRESGDYGCGLDCDEEGLGDKKAVAASIAELMRDYQWDQDFPRNS